MTSRNSTTTRHLNILHDDLNSIPGLKPKASPGVSHNPIGPIIRQNKRMSRTGPSFPLNVRQMPRSRGGIRMAFSESEVHPFKVIPRTESFESHTCYYHSHWSVVGRVIHEWAYAGTYRQT